MLKGDTPKMNIIDNYPCELIHAAVLKYLQTALKVMKAVDVCANMNKMVMMMLQEIHKVTQD